MVEDNTVSITCSKDWENSSRIPYFERLERSGGCWDLKYTFERSEGRFQTSSFLHQAEDRDREVTKF